MGDQTISAVWGTLRLTKIHGISVTENDLHPPVKTLTLNFYDSITFDFARVVNYDDDYLANEVLHFGN